MGTADVLGIVYDKLSETQTQMKAIQEVVSVAAPTVSKAIEEATEKASSSLLLQSNKAGEALQRMVENAVGRIEHAADSIIANQQAICAKLETVHGKEKNNREENKFGNIEIIQVSDGSGLIRVENEGIYLPSEKLRKKELENLKKGYFTKEELAEKYFGQKEISSEDRRKKYERRG